MCDDYLEIVEAKFDLHKLCLPKRNKSELFRNSKLLRVCFFTIIIRIDTYKTTAESNRLVALGGVS